MEFLTSDAVKLNYQDQGHGQPIILVEGFGGYQEIWKLQVKYLLKMDCRVITYDHRNHGQSQRTKKGLTMHRLTADLAELIDYLKLEQPILIGHSMGASVCYDYLSNYKNVKAVMSIDQSPKMLNDTDWPFGFEKITYKNFVEQLAHPSEKRETAYGLNRKVALALSSARNDYPFVRNDNLTLLLDHAQKDWRRTLVKSKVPITLMVAKQSPYFNYGFAKKLSTINPKVTAVEIDNCGHDIMAEVPEAFNQSLRHFVFSTWKN